MLEVRAEVPDPPEGLLKVKKPRYGIITEPFVVGLVKKDMNPSTPLPYFAYLIEPTDWIYI